MAKRVRLHFSDALDAFLSDPRIRGRLKPSTLPAYRTDLQAAALALPAQLAAISPAELRAYLDQKIAPSTAARRLAALRALFAWVIREDHCGNEGRNDFQADAQRTGTGDKAPTFNGMAIIAPVVVCRRWRPSAQWHLRLLQLAAAGGARAKSAGAGRAIDQPR